MAIYFTQNTNSIEDIEQMNKVIEKVNNSNTTATVNISKLTDLNAKAEELSSNIQQALPINTELKENIKIGQPLVQEAVSKNTELQASLEKTKEFINGLDGSQNIPQLRLDVTELQNGLKSNQALEYQGSSISADNTLEGRTEGMKIKGKTMYKKKDGTYTDTWEEGVTLESFGEAEGNKISILSHGKNLFNNYFEVGTLAGGNTIIDPQIFRTRDFIKVKSNTKYVFSSNNGSNSIVKVFYDKNKKWINDDVTKSNTFTTPSNCEHIKLRSFLADSQLDWINASHILEEGTQATPYEPYKSDKKDILIKEPLRENDLLYEDNGQVKVYRPTKQYTFTGNETIIFIKAREKTICFNVNFTNDGVDNSLNVMCNNFLVTASCYSYDVEGFFGTKKGIFCSILKSKLTTPDIEGFKAWLKANPTKIVYQLAEPTTEIVENCVDIDLDTFGEKTYFNILNSLPGTLDFKVPSNIASIVQNTAREVNNIWDVINNLLVPSLIDINKNVAMATIKNNLK